MKRQIKILSLFFALTMAAQTLSACGGEGSSAQTTAADSADTTTAPVTEEVTTQLSDELPDVTFDGDEINILAAVKEWQTDYFVEESTGEVLNDAVYKRNVDIQEHFDVKLNFNIHGGYSSGRDGVAAALKGAVMSGDGSVDIYLANSAYVSGNLMSDLFINLNDQEYLDFSKPWWHSEINDNMVVNDKLFLAAGTWGTSSLSRAWATYFNKTVADDYNVPDLYAEVNNGTWTVERMLEIAKPIYSDLNGDGAVDAEDQFGVISEGSLRAIYFGMDVKYTEYVDGVPTLAKADDRMGDIFSIISGIYNDEQLKTGIFLKSLEEDIATFGENRALFMIYTLNAAGTDEMRAVDDFGLLPLAKYDEAQEKYMCHAFTEVVGIPRGVDAADAERNAILLEAFCAEGYLNVFPVYKNISLERKYARDTESAEMIDLILDGIYTDFALPFYTNLDARMLNIGDMVKDYESYSRWLAENQTSVEAKLKDITDSIGSFED